MRGGCVGVRIPGETATRYAKEAAFADYHCHYHYCQQCVCFARTKEGVVCGKVVDTVRMCASGAALRAAWLKAEGVSTAPRRHRCIADLV